MNDEQEALNFYSVGREHFDAGRWEDAIAAFQESARLSPHFKSLELLGESYLALGRPKEAIVPLAAAVALNRQVRAAVLLAEALEQVEDFAGARAAAEEAERRDPNNKRTRELLGRLPELT